MLRSVPRVLDPGTLPVFTSPQEVIDWIQAVDWLAFTDRSVVLHLDDDGRLTCVATTPGRLHDCSSLSRDVIAAETIDCGTSAVIGVDIRRKLSPKRVSDVDRSRHRSLRIHLAAHGVALLDTVIVAPDDGVSVTGVLTPPLRIAPGGLRVHIPVRPRIPDVYMGGHESADFYPHVRRLTPTLWPDDDEPY